MFCIHCKYTSFDYLPSCPRCGRDWTQEKKALNLDWVVASAPEGKHQRQVRPQEQDVSFPGAAFGTWSAPGEAQPEAEPSAAPMSRPDASSPQLTDSRTADRGRDDQDRGSTENELDFPELDELLQPENTTQSQEPPSRRRPQAGTDQAGPDQADGARSSEPEEQEDDFLDLSSLVHDLGLDMDDSEYARTTRRDEGQGSRSEDTKTPSSG